MVAQIQICLPESLCIFVNEPTCREKKLHATSINNHNNNINQKKQHSHFLSIQDGGPIVKLVYNYKNKLVHDTFVIVIITTIVGT